MTVHNFRLFILQNLGKLESQTMHAIARIECLDNLVMVVVSKLKCAIICALPWRSSIKNYTDPSLLDPIRKAIWSSWKSSSFGVGQIWICQPAQLFSSSVTLAKKSWVEGQLYQFEQAADYNRSTWPTRWACKSSPHFAHPAMFPEGLCQPWERGSVF